jgi:hypothetical protein
MGRLSPSLESKWSSRSTKVLPADRSHDCNSENDSAFDAVCGPRRQASLAFRNALPEAREELIAEVVANAYHAYARLVERGKKDVAFATPLAQYAP